MSQRGVAAPMALMILSLITVLMLAFVSVSQTEPVIAGNLLQSTQARALADSGVERALWALTTGAIPDPIAGATAAAPYDGDAMSFQQVSALGGFVVSVSNSLDALGNPIPNERVVTSVGWAPTNNAADLRPKAVKKIRAVVTRIKQIRPPCALCAGGETPPATVTTVQIGGAATVNASSGAGTPAAAYCPGQTPSAAVYTQGIVETNGTPSLTAPPGGSVTQTGMPNAGFSSFILTDSDLETLKAMAKARGTYYQGSQTWTSPPPDGLVVVDTPSGQPLSPASPYSDMIMVDMHGTWADTFNGWIVVAGSVVISGRVSITGLVYSQNDITLHGSSSGGGINGALISTNRVDTMSTNIDDETIGNMPVTYNCPAVKNGGGTLSEAWFVKPGTYTEIAGR
jgi:hypothetical protein